MAWFLTRDNEQKRADESLVKKTFHNLRRQYLREWEEEEGAGILIAGANAMSRSSARNAILGDIPSADPDEVVSWLEDQKSRVRHDPRIKDRLRPVWQAKLDSAISSARVGNTPDIATFKAWKSLEPEVRSIKTRPTVGSPPPIDRGDYGRLLARARILRREYERQIAQRGTLHMTEVADPAMETLRRELEKADAAVTAAGGDIWAIQIEEQRSLREEAVNNIRCGIGDAAENHRLAGYAQASFARSLANHPDMTHLRERIETAHTDVSVWESLPDTHLASRRDQWHALEYLSQEYDHHLVVTGQVAPEEKQRRMRERKRIRSQLRGIG